MKTGKNKKQGSYDTTTYQYYYKGEQGRVNNREGVISFKDEEKTEKSKYTEKNEKQLIEF